ncbi:MAG: SDR family NAD(P)-dependent oxidoreductase [Pseudomonadota bacterium]
MKDFSGKIAVVTGGGAGMGRELTRQLAAAGCSVAICDISEEDMAETKRLAEDGAPQGVKITTFKADVADRGAVEAFRDHVLDAHDTDHIHLHFNNAGVGGGGSFVAGEEDHWERTFNVCWQGVYNNARAFMPALMKADEAHIINVSSVNGFWASLGPETPHTAYSAAKFAVKGFTEALTTDLKLNAPHVKASVVMPGHIGTNIALTTLREFGDDAVTGDMPGGPAVSPEEARQRAEEFRDNGTTSAEDAATIILDGVKEEKWRILVGPDAHAIDAAVRNSPEKAYEPEFGLEIFDFIQRGQNEEAS